MPDAVMSEPSQNSASSNPPSSSTTILNPRAQPFKPSPGPGGASASGTASTSAPPSRPPTPPWLNPKKRGGPVKGRALRDMLASTKSRPSFVKPGSIAKPTSSFGSGWRARGVRGPKGGSRKVDAPPRLEDSYVVSRVLNFATAADWTEEALARPGIRKVTFGPSFEVEDSHLLQIAALPQLAKSLECFIVSSAPRITNSAFQSLASACPSLLHLQLDAALELDDATFLKILDACPKLLLLRITGSEQKGGALTDASVKALESTEDGATKLAELYLADQIWIEQSAVESLSAVRKTLKITHGESEGGDLSTFVGGKLQGSS